MEVSCSPPWCFSLFFLLEQLAQDFYMDGLNGIEQLKGRWVKRAVGVQPSRVREDRRIEIPFLGVALERDFVRHLNDEFGRPLSLKKPLVEIVLCFQAPYASTGLRHELLEALHHSLKVFTCPVSRYKLPRHRGSGPLGPGPSLGGSGPVGPWPGGLFRSPMDFPCSAVRSPLQLLCQLHELPPGEASPWLRPDFVHDSGGLVISISCIRPS